jgi:hypothetical protein
MADDQYKHLLCAYKKTSNFRDEERIRRETTAYVFARWVF